MTASKCSVCRVQGHRRTNCPWAHMLARKDLCRDYHSLIALFSVGAGFVIDDKDMEENLRYLGIDLRENNASACLTQFIRFFLNRPKQAEEIVNNWLCLCNDPQFFLTLVENLNTSFSAADEIDPVFEKRLMLEEGKNGLDIYFDILRLRDVHSALNSLAEALDKNSKCPLF